MLNTVTLDIIISIRKKIDFGIVGEWFIPEVLKTSVLKGTVCSNQTDSAIFIVS